MLLLLLQFECLDWIYTVKFLICYLLGDFVEILFFIVVLGDEFIKKFVLEKLMVIFYDKEKFQFFVLGLEQVSNIIIIIYFLSRNFFRNLNLDFFFKVFLDYKNNMSRDLRLQLICILNYCCEKSL